MTLPQIFMYESHQVRTVTKDGEPWFVAKDVCDVLEIGNPSQALSRLDEDEKGLISIDTPGGKQEMLCVSEPGLYDLILGSKKTEAKPFKRWVKHEVLPTIRKTGSYGVHQLPQNYVEALESLVEQTKTRIALEVQAEVNAPKVALYDTAMSAKNNMTMMHVAKTLGIGRNKLFDFLRDQKVLMKNNMPYETYVSRGYFDVRQYTITHFTTSLENKTQTLVTPKGMAWIHTLLREGVTT